MGIEKYVTNRKAKHPSFTHMKPAAQNWYDTPEKWMLKIQTYVNTECEIKIGNYQQSGIFHYTEDDFVDDSIIEKYKDKCNVG